MFYGWRIVAAGSVLQGLGGILLFHSFGAYFVYLQSEFGWNRTLLSGAISAARVEGGLLGPIQGWLINRIGPRAVVYVGLVIFGLGFFYLSQIDSVGGLYTALLVLGVGSSFTGFFTVNIVLANWFVRKRAFAMSAGAMGFSLAGLLVPAVAWALANFGWRATAVASGVIVLALGLPVAYVFRHAPEPYGLAPDGDPSPHAGASDGDPIAIEGFTVRQALRTTAFWLLVGGHTSALFAVSAMSVHLIPYLVDQRHIAIEAAAAVAAAMTAISWIGQLLGGQLGDRLEKRAIAAVCMLGHTAAMIIMVFSASFVPLAIGACVHGLFWGIRGPLMMAVRAEYFGRREFATIEGFASMITGFGLFLGPVAVGLIADLTADYRPGYGFLACMTLAGFLCFIFAPKQVPPPLLDLS